MMEREKTQLKRDMTHLQNGMGRLNKSTFAKKTNGNHLERENELAEKEFILTLRAKEQEAVDLESKLNAVINEKEDLLADLIETE